MTVSLEGARAFLAEALTPRVHPRCVALEVSARHLPGEPEPPARAVGGPFEAFGVGQRWGGMWSTTWFRFRSAIPPAWSGQEVVALVHLGGATVVGFSAEGLVWTPDLVPVQGLHHHHRQVPVAGLAGRDGTVDFYVEAAANPIPPWDRADWPPLEPDYRGPALYTLERADLATVDRGMEALVADMEVVIQMAEWMEDRRGPALAALGRAVELVVGADRSATGAARDALRPLLDRAGPVPGPGRRHQITAVGHAHIDTAWLWPVRETRRKCGRSFANQLRLLERYAEYTFVCSQAVQYQWVKEDYPDLYRQIQAMVAAGRWEPVGGMWVESDTNIPSGESLVRQFVHGQRFFRDEFGVGAREMWIPDVFGYSAALPQIARGVGVDVLITQKMSWNDTNTFPHSTFWWEGHDGSRVLAHFPPAATYNGSVSVPELLADDRNFADGARSGHTLYPFGYGDGGGGPAAHQIEAARRLADIDGLPRMSLGRLDTFLDALRQEAERAGLATWVGELYLEAHRATATTHADVKLANRRAEEALRAAELWSVAAGRGGPQLQGRLDALWELLLLNQFHDIIPGSSIAWVYRDAAVDHRGVLEGGREVIDAALSDLAPPDGAHRAVFNPSSYDRAEVVEVRPGELAWVEVAGCGWAPLAPRGPRGGAPRPVAAGPTHLDNGIVRVTLDDRGLVTSIWDHAEGREVVAAGERANLFQLHEDHPKAFDAWDVDFDYLERVEDLDGPLDQAPRIVEQRPLRAALGFSRRFGTGSTLSQTVRLRAGARRIDFLTEIDWQERHRFLKVAFPVAVRAERAAYEIQHGYVERPTHANTSWDRARFEVCGHRWAHLGEPGYGAALLNDCKYGYDVRGHTLRLSLLRGPGFPDPNADRGLHRFTYSLLAHPGDHREGRVVEEAEALNLPLEIRDGRVRGAGRLVEVDRPGVSIEAVKRPEQGDGVVLRLCEVHGSRQPVTVTWHQPFDVVVRTDLLEQPVATLDHTGRSVRLALRPFELVTLRFGCR